MALDFPKLFKHLTDKSNPHSITTTQIGAATTAQGTKADNAVPKTTTVNGKALSGNISLTASDVGASSTSHTHSQYATLATPTFTGTPKAPTATAGTNNTQIATTAFVQSLVSTAAKVESGSYTGDGGSSRVLTFSFNPKLVIVIKNYGFDLETGYIAFAVQGKTHLHIIGESNTSAYANMNNSGTCTWGTNTLTFTSTWGMNANGISFDYIAIG